VKTRKQTLNLFLSACLAVFLIQACGFPADSGGDQTKYTQTKILNIKVQPDTVAPGDTASFTCIIEDSTDNRFKFYWAIDKGEVLNGTPEDPDYPTIFTTESNRTNWKAPNEEGFYSFEVTANNGSEDSLGVRSSFSIVVE
jgi:hypothetical protein